MKRGVPSATAASEDVTPKTSFQHFHYYSLPILALLGLIDIFDCIDSGITDFDLLFVSETFPNWSDDELSIFLNPEAPLFGNPAALLAQPIDCLGANAYRPVDQLFWMAGCWGSHYPLGGYADQPHHAKAASIRVSRSLFLLHRIGMAKRQGGQDGLCGGVREPIMTKSFYRKQHYWPIPETGRQGPTATGADGSPGLPIPTGSFLPTCCHALGASPTLYGEFRRTVGGGEDSMHLAWRWNDCCVGVCI
jgi:conjugal transfer pilus assembly protein TraU